MLLVERAEMERRTAGYQQDTAAHLINLNARNAAEAALREIAVLCGSSQWTGPRDVVRRVRTALDEILVGAHPK